MAEAKSGYEAVYQDLLRTKEAEAVLDSLRMWCSQAGVSDYAFRVETDHETGLARTRTLWSVRFGPVMQDFRDDEYTKFRLDFERALGDEDAVSSGMTAAKLIVDANLGVPGRVGTRNCSRKVVLDGKQMGRHTYQRGFYQALYDHANGHPQLSEVRRQAEANIVGAMVRVSRSDEFGRRRHLALCEAAATEVKKVMRKYRDVPDSVLAEAVREAAVEGVMDW